MFLFNLPNQTKFRSIIERQTLHFVIGTVSLQSISSRKIITYSTCTLARFVSDRSAKADSSSSRIQNRQRIQKSQLPEHLNAIHFYLRLNLKVPIADNNFGFITIDSHNFIYGVTTRFTILIYDAVKIKLVLHGATYIL